MAAGPTCELGLTRAGVRSATPWRLIPGGSASEAPACWQRPRAESRASGSVEQLVRESRASERFDACQDRGCHFGRFAKGHYSSPRRGLTKEGHRPRRLHLNQQEPDLLPAALCEPKVTTLGDEIEAYSMPVRGEARATRATRMPRAADQ
jgi:hypothetical protein